MPRSLETRLARLEAHHAELAGPMPHDLHAIIVDAWNTGVSLEDARSKAEAAVNPAWSRRRQRIGHALVDLLAISARDDADFWLYGGHMGEAGRPCEP